jgi:type VI secretion system secreted protein Hcp
MAIDYFLNIGNKTVKGESKDEKHKEEIDVQSWSWGETNSGTFGLGGGGGSGKVSMQDFHFVMAVNSATPKLMEACATGQHFPSALLTCREAGTEQQEFLLIKFTDILVSSFQTGGASGSDLKPTDQISLNFAQVDFEYHPQNEDGTLGGAIKGGWDTQKNKKTT